MEAAGKDPITGKFQKNNKTGAGRPQGSKSSAQLAIEQISLEGAQTIVAKVIEQAMAGDFQSQKLILDRVYPIPKARTFTTCEGISNIHTQKDINAAMTHVIECATHADPMQRISLEEAETLTQLLIKKKETMDECLHETVVEMQKRIKMI